MQEGHNLCCRRFHPKGLCLLPSMYYVTVTPTLVQHQQWNLEQCVNGCHKAKSDQEANSKLSKVKTCPWEQSWELSNLGQTRRIIASRNEIGNLIPRGYNPSSSIPRTRPLSKIRTRKSSINQSHGNILSLPRRRVTSLRTSAWETKCLLSLTHIQKPLLTLTTCIQSNQACIV